MSNTSSGAVLKRPTYDGDPVPESIAVLFWDAPERPLELVHHRALLVRRVLNEGSWSACRWLLGTLGSGAIAAELRCSAGRGIDRRSLRLWQVLLELPESEVDGWLAIPERKIWDQRSS